MQMAARREGRNFRAPTAFSGARPIFVENVNSFQILYESATFPRFFVYYKMNAVFLAEELRIGRSLPKSERKL